MRLALKNRAPVVAAMVSIRDIFEVSFVEWRIWVART